MRIYLAQPGQAAPGTSIPTAPVSEQAGDDARRLPDVLGNAGIAVARVLPSGKTRAEQTAAILASSRA
jgi:phosphohistidine phosphatase